MIKYCSLGFILSKSKLSKVCLFKQTCLAVAYDLHSHEKFDMTSLVYIFKFIKRKQRIRKNIFSQFTRTEEVPDQKDFNIRIVFYF